jgi:hypothetical protein
MPDTSGIFLLPQLLSATAAIAMIVSLFMVVQTMGYKECCKSKRKFAP